MGIKETISNPWVLGGGLLLGVVILAVSHGGGGSTDSAPESGANAAFAAQNAAGMEYSFKQSQLVADVSMSQTKTMLQQVQTFMQGLGNLAAVDANHDVQVRAINADIVKSRIQSQAIVAQNYDQQATRLAMTYVGADVSKFGIKTQKEINAYSTDAQMAIQNNQATQAAGSANLASVLAFIPKIMGAL